MGNDLLGNVSKKIDNIEIIGSRINNSLSNVDWDDDVHESFLGLASDYNNFTSKIQDENVNIGKCISSLDDQLIDKLGERLDKVSSMIGELEDGGR